MLKLFPVWLVRAHSTCFLYVYNKISPDFQPISLSGAQREVPGSPCILPAPALKLKTEVWKLGVLATAEVARLLGSLSGQSRAVTHTHPMPHFHLRSPTVRTLVPSNIGVRVYGLSLTIN